MNDKIKDAFEKQYGKQESPFHLYIYEQGYLAAQKEAAEQKPVAEVHTWDKFGVSVFSLVRDGRVIVEGTKLYAAPVDQSARIAELEAENQKLRKVLHNFLIEPNSEAAKIAHTKESIGLAIQLLLTKSDTTALDSLLEAERVKTAEACAAYVTEKYNFAKPMAEAIRNGDWKGFVK